jgi:hypothetical protein
VTAKATVRYYQKRSNAVTGYKAFAGRTQFLAGQEGWEEVADYALDWALRHAGNGSAGRPAAGGARGSV